MKKNKNNHGYNKKTYALIKQLALVKRDEPKKFTEIDQFYLEKLIGKEIDYE
jgi:hypothetical protein